MTERTVLEWEDLIYEERFTHSISKGKGQTTWEIKSRGGSMIDNITYALTVGRTLIIKVNIATIEEAKQMAQDLQDVLDGNNVSVKTLTEQMVIAFQRGRKSKIDKLTNRIQDVINNIRRFQSTAGTSRAINDSYEDGRADAYIIVLSWLEELEKE